MNARSLRSKPLIRAVVVGACAFLVASCETQPRSMTNYTARRHGVTAPAAQPDQPPPPPPPVPGEPVFQANDKIHLQVLAGRTLPGKYFLERGDVVHVEFAFQGGEYHLLGGDELRVHFASDPKLDYTVFVRPDGRITLPEAGEVEAAGHSTLALTKVLEEKYRERLRNPSITVSVVKANTAMLESMRGDFLVRADGLVALPFLGEVAAAGRTPAEVAKSLAEAASARFKNTLSFYVTSELLEGNRVPPKAGLMGFDQTLTVSPEGLLVLPEIGAVKAGGLTYAELVTELNRRVKERYTNPVDIAVTLVASETRVIYVQGEVGRSGIYPLTRGLTLLKAITLAGGTTNEADLREVVLIHYKTPVDIEVYKTNVRSLLAQGSTSNDVLLSPQDVVFVPKTGVAKANLFIEQYISRMLPFSRSVNYSYSEMATSTGGAAVLPVAPSGP